jgi:hypothetical protein
MCEDGDRCAGGAAAKVIFDPRKLIAGKIVLS